VYDALTTGLAVGVCGEYAVVSVEAVSLLAEGQAVLKHYKTSN
jgi:hypothetical protein